MARQKETGCVGDVGKGEKKGVGHQDETGADLAVAPGHQDRAGADLAVDRGVQGRLAEMSRERGDILGEDRTIREGLPRTISAGQQRETDRPGIGQDAVQEGVHSSRAVAVRQNDGVDGGGGALCVQGRRSSKRSNRVGDSVSPAVSRPGSKRICSDGTR